MPLEPVYDLPLILPKFYVHLKYPPGLYILFIKWPLLNEYTLSAVMTDAPLYSYLHLLF